jgi:hypothetical protein
MLNLFPVLCKWKRSWTETHIYKYCMFNLQYTLLLCVAHTYYVHTRT